MQVFKEDIQFIFNAMKRISSKWTTQIVYAIMKNKILRFKELEKKVEGINTKILINELKSLECHGIINRKVFAEVPSRVEYSLTKKGKDLTQLYSEIILFGKKHSNLSIEVDAVEKTDVIKQQLSFAMELVASKWSIPIVYSLLEKERRFKTLERYIEGISTRMLVKELLHLEEKKIISRTSYPEVPPRVEYALTDKGKSLYKVFGELIAYAKKYPD
jgi:DNA-binding HxlR family transcriptional regulator